MRLASRLYAVAGIDDTASLTQAANNAVLVFRQHVGLHIVDAELARHGFRRRPQWSPVNITMCTPSARRLSSAAGVVGWRDRR
jgi:hypothetical protein